MSTARLRSDRLKASFGGYAYKGLVDSIIDEARSFLDAGLSAKQAEEKLCETHPENLVEKALKSMGAGA